MKAAMTHFNAGGRVVFCDDTLVSMATDGLGSLQRSIEGELAQSSYE